MADLGLFFAGIPRSLIITMSRMVAPALVLQKSKHKLCKTITTVNKIKLGIWDGGGRRMKVFGEGKKQDIIDSLLTGKGEDLILSALPRDSRDLFLLFSIWFGLFEGRVWGD